MPHVSHGRWLTQNDKRMKPRAPAGDSSCMVELIGVCVRHVCVEPFTLKGSTFTKLLGACGAAWTWSACTLAATSRQARSSTSGSAKVPHSSAPLTLITWCAIVMLDMSTRCASYAPLMWPMDSYTVCLFDVLTPCNSGV